MGKNDTEFYMPRTIPSLKQAPFTNHFVFEKAMMNEKLCKLFLEEVLGKEIKYIQFIDREKDLSDGCWQHGIRMDVFLNDEEGTVYNVELENNKKDDLERRVRYYQSGIDRHTLKKKESYRNLKESYIIFVCSMDYFGFGKAVYRRKMILEDVEYSYDDGSHVLFLNSEYTDGNASKAVLEFLDFVKDSMDVDVSEAVTDLGKTVRETVDEVRNNKGLEAQYMTFEMLLLEREEQGMEKGMKQGMEEKENAMTINMGKIFRDIQANVPISDIAKKYGIGEKVIKSIAQELQAL